MSTKTILQNNNDIIENNNNSIDELIERINNLPNGEIAPEGTLEITANGTYNVLEYSDVNVNVSTTDIEDGLVTRLLSGDYVNNRITVIGSEGLRATQITSLSCENVTNVGGEGVRQCERLVEVYLPKCTNLSGYCFGLCSSLEKVELGAITSIKAYDFYNCPKLYRLIIRNTSSVCSLANVNAFTGSGIESGTGYIYVPDDLVNSYRSATNWSTYANQIRGLNTLTHSGGSN